MGLGSLLIGIDFPGNFFLLFAFMNAFDWAIQSDSKETNDF